MLEVFTLLIAAGLAFVAHQLGELFLFRKGKRDIRLIVRSRQIHHSLWGVLSITLAVVFANGFVMLAMVGYGIGNIWQHKVTHNRAGERGFVFISKVK